MNDQFTVEKESEYRSKIALVLQKIPVDINNEELGQLRQAISELENFYERGKRQWFTQLVWLFQKYRAIREVREIWTTIEPDLDQFWREISPAERSRVFMGTHGFDLPNLYSKPYHQLAGIISGEIQMFVSELNEDYSLEMSIGENSYGIIVRGIQDETLFEVTCLPEGIRVRVKDYSQHEDVEKTLFRLFDLCNDFLKS